MVIAMTKPDEVMAEYLLKGGKMLARDCTVCGCPIFEYKGETFCVVCRAEKEEATREGRKGAKKMPKEARRETMAPIEETPIQETPTFSAPPGPVRDALESAIIALCRRCEEEVDPDRCLALMSAVRKGIEARQLLDTG